MQKILDINEVEDNSVNELLNKTANQLHKKYNKQRKIKEKLLNKKSPLRKVFSILLDVFCISMIAVAVVVCFSSLNASLNGFIPSFAGYTNMIVSSESMEASGYYVGDPVIVHSVKPETLKKDDIIAFYVYKASYENFSVVNAEIAPTYEGKIKYSLTASELFGFKSDEFKQAVSADSELVFHHISKIYIDENGDRWFKTYGSSNGGEDSWYVHESLIVGVNDESVVSKCMIWLLSLTTKQYGIFIIMIPAAIMLLITVYYFLKNIQIAKLELDCVEEKRKITDPICVKNGVGYQMSKKTKYKILAQSTSKNRNEYIKLLWKDGNLPDSLKKYYLKKRIVLKPMEDKLKLNRECERKFKRGVKPTKIAKFYLEEKKKIEMREDEIRRRLKNLKKLQTN